MAAPHQTTGDLRALLKRVMELVKPDVRDWYRVVRKARIVASYAAEDGRYYADVQPLRNDETVDPNEPMIPQVAIPVHWGGPQRGLVCPPQAGCLCDLSYYDGDANYPTISNVRWDQGNAAPRADLREIVIQLDEETHAKIDKRRNVLAIVNIPKAGQGEGDKARKSILFEVGRIPQDEEPGGMFVIRAPRVCIYTDQSVSGTYDQCPDELKASTWPTEGA